MRLHGICDVRCFETMEHQSHAGKKGFIGAESSSQIRKEYRISEESTSEIKPGGKLSVCDNFSNLEFAGIVQILTALSIICSRNPC